MYSNPTPSTSPRVRASRLPSLSGIGLPSLLGLSFLAFSGCAMEQQATEADRILLSLGYDDSHDSVLGNFGPDFSALTPADLGLSDSKLTSASARAVLADMDAVAIDLEGMERADIDRWMPIFDEAMALGVPVMIENARDADLVANVIGVGFEADLVYVTSEGDRHRVQVLGDYDDASTGSGSSREDEVQALPVPRAPLDVALAANTLADQLRTYERPLTKAGNGTYLYDVNFSTLSWNINDTGQIATLNMDFEIELVADQVVDRKYAIIRESGGGVHPGTLLHNGSKHRGYFNESIKVWIDSQTSALDLAYHAPDTTSTAVNYSSSTGYTAGFSGTDVTLTYSSSSVTSTTISDFSVVNETQGVDPAWEWKLTSVNGHSYNNWKDIYYHKAFEDCKMYSLPDKAKGNITPRFEAIFKASSGFNSNASFKLTTEALVRRSKAGGDWFTCNQNTYYSWYTRWKNVTVDFSKVSVD